MSSCAAISGECSDVIYPLIGGVFVVNLHGGAKKAAWSLVAIRSDLSGLKIAWRVVNR